MRGVVTVEFGTDDKGNPIKHKMKFGNLELGRAQQALGVSVSKAFSSGMSPTYVLMNLLFIGISRFEPQWELEDFADVFDEEVSAERIEYWLTKVREATAAAMPKIAAANKEAEAKAAADAEKEAKNAPAPLEQAGEAPAS